MVSGLNYNDIHYVPEDNLYRYNIDICTCKLFMNINSNCKIFVETSRLKFSTTVIH